VTEIFTLTAVGLPDGAELKGVGSWRVVEADKVPAGAEVAKTVKK